MDRIQETKLRFTSVTGVRLTICREILYSHMPSIVQLHYVAFISISLTINDLGLVFSVFLTNGLFRAERYDDLLPKQSTGQLTTNSCTAHLIRNQSPCGLSASPTPLRHSPLNVNSPNYTELPSLSPVTVNFGCVTRSNDLKGVSPQ